MPVLRKLLSQIKCLFDATPTVHNAIHHFVMIFVKVTAGKNQHNHTPVRLSPNTASLPLASAGEQDT